MAICNKSVETLRALELTKDQFESLIEKDCKGQDRGPILGHTFTDKDKELCESFKKVYQLGLNQLQIFVNDLIRDNPEIDEQSAIYYTGQLYNGPFTNSVVDYAQNPHRGLGKTQNCFFPSPDTLASLANTAQQNAGVPVYFGVPKGITTNLSNKTPAFIRKNLDTCQRACADVFNYNAESAVYSDNTLPYINKRPRRRVNTEHSGEYTSQTIAVSNLMLKDIKFSKILRGIANAIIGIIEDYLGKDAFRLFTYKRNINYFNPSQNIAKTKNEAVRKSVVLLKRVFDEQGKVKLEEECVEIFCSCCNGPSVPNFGLTISTEEGSFDLYTVAGQGGSGSPPKENPNIGGTQMTPTGGLSARIADDARVDGGNPAALLAALDTSTVSSSGVGTYHSLSGYGIIPGVINVTTFTTPLNASQKTLELTNGTLSGSHIHTTSTGKSVWMPFPDMPEFREYLTQAVSRDICAEKEDCDKTLGF